ncbi:hypothetical protein CDAR_484131 [Caerostris darwini]|uniref:Uncharacterized protein n=1 Tax=Caerostris darwini TaxID=1538125 RepID=A0AAV4TAN9_9ARAC|nr:hypothetical protein CDAR_484131 [Caerostris darwini]
MFFFSPAIVLNPKQKKHRRNKSPFSVRKPKVNCFILVYLRRDSKFNHTWPALQNTSTPHPPLFLFLFRPSFFLYRHCRFLYFVSEQSRRRRPNYGGGVCYMIPLPRDHKKAQDASTCLSILPSTAHQTVPGLIRRVTDGLSS